MGTEVVKQVWRWYIRCGFGGGKTGVGVKVVQQVWGRRWYSRCEGGGDTAGVGAELVQ